MIWSQIYRLIKFKLVSFVTTFITAVLFFATPLGIAYATKLIYDYLEIYGVVDQNIWKYITILILMYLIQIVTDFLFNWFMWNYVLSVQVLLRRNMLDGILSQHGARALHLSPGRTMARFRGDTTELAWFSGLLTDILPFVLMGIVSFIVMFTINAMITVVIFIPFLIVIYLSMKARDRLSSYRKATRKAAGKITGIIAETFGTIQAVKTSGSEEHLVDHFVELSETRRKAAIRDETFAAIVSRIPQIITALSIGLILLLAGNLMKTKQFSTGDFSLFYTMLLWLSGLIGYMGGYIAWYQRAKVSENRMTEVLRGYRDTDRLELSTAKEIYVKKTYPDIKPLIKTNQFESLTVDNLTYKIPDSNFKLDDISFTIKPNTLNIITGKNGSGKTTLLRSVFGLLPIDSGKIYWNDSLIDEPRIFFKSPKVSYTAQNTILFSDTVKENILMGLPEDSVDIQNSLYEAVVDQDIEIFNDGLDTMIGPKGIKLSGGQKHRISTARMLTRNADLILFDDLSAALDVRTEKKLWDRLFRNRNRTFLITTYRKSVLRSADQIIVLKNGKIDGIGKLDDLLKSSKEIQDIWKGKLK